MIKKFFCAILACFMILNCTACGGAESVPTSVPASAAAPDTSTSPFSASEQLELDKAKELGFPGGDLTRESISGAELSEILDHFVSITAPEKLEGWKEMYPALRASTEPLIRFDAIASLFLAANYVGGEYALMQSDGMSNAETLNHSWDEDYLNWDLYGGFEAVDSLDNGAGPAPLDGASYYYVLGRSSPFSGEYLFSVDPESNSLRVKDPCTYAEALCAVIRLMCSADENLMGSSPADTADETILTPELLELSQSNPAVTAEDHPLWRGMTLAWDFHAGNTASVAAIEDIASWGFNFVRIMTDYRNFFDPEDVSKSSAAGLRRLDEFVAAGIRQGIHIDICFTFLPGREVTPEASTFTSEGSFDLFINEEKQADANAIWQTIARRYSGVSNYNLSFTPFYEALNKNLSTGLPGPDYGPQDVAQYLGKVVDVIRAESPDRLIVYEPSPDNDLSVATQADACHTLAAEKGNMLISFNFCEQPFVYAHMTAEEGQHIDNNNHSMQTPSYPTAYYSLSGYLDDTHTLTLDGCLPAGTTIELYVAESFDAQLSIDADGVQLYQEALGEEAYSVSAPLSRYMLYRTSDKMIRITLTEDAQTVYIRCTAGGLNWCGIDVLLPESYAQDRWYYASEYDVFLGLEEESGVKQIRDARVMLWPAGDSPCLTATIHPNLTYTTPSVYAESSADTIAAWCDAIESFEGNCLIRFESGCFSGVEWEDMKAYYTDLLSAFEEKGFSWMSNDYSAITSEYTQTKLIAGCPSAPYEDYPHFNLELLELLQSYS